MSTQVEKIVREQAPIHHEMPCMYQLYNIVDAIDADGNPVKIKQPSRMVCKADLEREVANFTEQLKKLQELLNEIILIEEK